MIGFIKYNRSEQAENLESRPNENHLLSVIARRVSRTGNPVKGVEIGESLMGDYEKMGLTRQKYRTALANLQKWGYITTRVTNRITYARLCNSDVYDCNILHPNHQTNPKKTQEQPNPNHNQEDKNKELKNKEEEKEREKALSQIKELEKQLKESQLALKTEKENQRKKVAPKKESETTPPPTGENNQAAKRKTAKRKNKGDWTQLDITLHNLTLPEKWTEPLKEKVLEYWYYMDEKKGANWGTTQTIIRQRDAVTNHLQKFSISEIVDSLEEAMLKGNASYNPSWTKNRKDKEQKDKPNSKNDDGTPSYMMGLQ
jgi:hypothetical protein